MMKVLDWLCGCDSPNRDESAQYMAEKGTAGDLPQKTPVVCTEQPRSESDESDGRVIITPGGILPLQRTVGGGDAPKFATPSKDPQQIFVPPTTPPSFSSVVDSPIKMTPYSIASFPLTEDTVQNYRDLRNNVVNVLDDRIRRMETLLEDPLHELVEEDVRVARGKIMVIMKANLTKFGKLLDEAQDTPQGIADLTGFWGLVHTELEDVKRALGRVDEARRNDWNPVVRSPSPVPKTPMTKRAAGTRSGTQTPATRTPKPTPKTNPKLREFMAQKRREMQSAEQLPTNETQIVA